MPFIRGCIFYVIAAVTVIFPALAAILPWPFVSAYRRFGWSGKPWSKAMVAVLSGLCGMRWEVKGAENIPPAGTRNIVVLSKHQSAWETMFLPAFLPNHIGFVYKASLHWIPFLGWALKSMGMIAIDRRNGHAAWKVLMRKGPKFLEDGWWVILFPEGTRVAPGASARYKSGGARFAAATGSKILPVALNPGRLWPRNSIAKYPGTVTVSFGPLIETAGRKPEEVNAEVESWIEGEMKTL